MMIHSDLAQRLIPVGLGMGGLTMPYPGSAGDGTGTPLPITGDATTDSAAAADAAYAATLPPMYPSYCDWPLIGPLVEIFGTSCTPVNLQTQEQQAESTIQQEAGYGTANYNQDLANQQIALLKENLAAYCASNPTGCAAANLSNQSPTCAALLGTGSFAQTFCQSPGTYLIVGAAVVVGVMLMLAAKK